MPTQTVVEQTDIRLAEAAAAAAAEALAHASRQVHASEGRDIKAQADLDAETAMLDVLRRGSLPILSEERGADRQFSLDADGWIIDPLDGTMNFVRGIPVACTCVALWRGGAPVYGLIREHAREITWAGGVGHPATSNGDPCRCSQACDPTQAVLATGFPRCFDFSGSSMEAAMERFAAFKKVRMIGCAGLSLAWVAGGMMDIYCEDNVFLWDVAAGLAIVEAAGGVCQWRAPDSQFKTSVVAGSPELVSAMPLHPSPGE